MGGSGNRLVPIFGALALALLVAVMTRSCGREAPAPAGPRQAPAPDADTGADTLRAMAEQMKAMRAEAEAARKENDRLRGDQAEALARLRTDLESRRIEERRTDQAELAGKLEELGRRFGPFGSNAPSLEPPSPGRGDLPVGGTLESGLVWVEPLGAGGPGGVSSSSAAPAAPGFQNPGLLQDGAAPAGPPAPKPPEPAYTVPRNATLVGSTAMTALIGRVPMDGQVEDPFPFKVLVGRDNLAANGLEVPGVFGMVFSGTAFGDWTLGCVRGHVDSVTFVFDDGTTRTVSADGQGGAGSGGSVPVATAGGTAGGSIRRGLGWISDRRGIPCVTGRRISNAADYLGGRMFARGLEVAGRAFARTQQTINTTPLGGYTSAVTGDAAQYALGETVAGGADELAKFIAERQARQFDVVYVDTGAEVAVHVDREIAIDYEPNGRKLDYARASAPLRHPGRGGLD